uniref:Uncharacterized protein n=1 Tax=Desertifilum tharense IPPAS B-1220 TaxID=1781255 RepID=A0ACD5GTN9_9CYAN
MGKKRMGGGEMGGWGEEGSWELGVRGWGRKMGDKSKSAIGLDTY